MRQRLDNARRTWLSPLFRETRRMVERPRPRHWLWAGAAAVVIAALATAVGLVWQRQEPATQASPDDAYASAPACGALASDTVESVVPRALLETNEHGLLAGSDSATCEWTSVDSAQAPARVLHVDYEAHFTDKAGGVSGADAAREELARLTSTTGIDRSEPVPSVGPEAVVWSSTPGAGSAEVAFRRDNLVVRVFYSGEEADGGDALSYGEARDGVSSVADRIASAL
ncbi:hypothetical protein FHX37_2273 [Haloactinospora alba]|uniref:DUF3558 family protein n=1 Tax=Haloactinospora alba TaxID=405555 RepID=A0A543NKK2_9ACTN|nr:hypothetical protein [Haloactinospora alba]TQN32322.1 hypothetical protein FHX37_2273 [Haloactinospora alba]